MSMTTQMVVTEIEARNVTVQGQPKTIYDVIDQDGNKWVAWERPTAEQAHALKGQQAIAEVEVKQNGQYTNRTLKRIRAVGDPTMTGALDTLGGSASSSSSSGSSTTTFPDLPGPVSDDAKQKSIHRQVAAKVAAEVAKNGGTANEFWDNVQALYAYFETGQTPGAMESTTAAFPDESDGIPF